MNFRSKTKRRQQQRAIEKEIERERVKELRQLLGALQPEVDFRVDSTSRFRAALFSLQLKWFYWVSSANHHQNTHALFLDQAIDRAYRR